MEYVQVTKAKIGRYASIADFVTIGAGEHDLEEISTSGHLAKSSANYGDLTKMPCEIGPDVWIGVCSIIRRGVKIGVGAVVGANSFVNKDVPPFAVVAGSPAKIIKYRFNEETRQKILESKYWEYEPDAARKIIAELTEFYEKSKGDN
ncbi:CatB-related O-acetyltransferase [bacterium]|nr:CatB-related O-acetyltransferase [bacterium]